MDESFLTKIENRLGMPARCSLAWSKQNHEGLQKIKISKSFQKQGGQACHFVFPQILSRSFENHGIPMILWAKETLPFWRVVLLTPDIFLKIFSCVASILISGSLSFFGEIPLKISLETLRHKRRSKKSRSGKERNGGGKWWRWEKVCFQATIAWLFPKIGVPQMDGL